MPPNAAAASQGEISAALNTAMGDRYAIFKPSPNCAHRNPATSHDGEPRRTTVRPSHRIRVDDDDDEPERLEAQDSRPCVSCSD
jgi:hypothetical protein